MPAWSSVDFQLAVTVLVRVKKVQPCLPYMGRSPAKEPLQPASLHALAQHCLLSIERVAKPAALQPHSRAQDSMCAGLQDLKESFTCEGEERQGYGYGHIDAHHAHIDLVLELPGCGPRLREDGGSIAVLLIVHDLDGLIQCVSLRITPREQFR